MYRKLVVGCWQIVPHQEVRTRYPPVRINIIFKIVSLIQEGLVNFK